MRGTSSRSGSLPPPAPSSSSTSRVRAARYGRSSFDGERGRAGMDVPELPTVDAAPRPADADRARLRPSRRPLAHARELSSKVTRTWDGGCSRTWRSPREQAPSLRLAFVALAATLLLAGCGLQHGPVRGAERRANGPTGPATPISAPTLDRCRSSTGRRPTDTSSSSISGARGAVRATPSSRSLNTLAAQWTPKGVIFLGVDVQRHQRQRCSVRAHLQGPVPERQRLRARSSPPSTTCSTRRR